MEVWFIIVVIVYRGFGVWLCCCGVSWGGVGRMGGLFVVFVWGGG